jgi:pimeloyl-ACP methyl ester carboxylesterase
VRVSEEGEFVEQVGVGAGVVAGDLPVGDERQSGVEDVVGEDPTVGVELMRRLGYQRFFAQGGDWGAFATTSMGARHSDVLDGVHLNLAICDPEAVAALGDLTEQVQGQLAALENYVTGESGYSQQQATRPQTLGYGLVDSPAGQCAWVLEKFRAWTDCDGHPENVISRDRMLDDISLYWFTATAASSARLYWESFRDILADFSQATAPTVYSAFPKDLFTVTERWARTRYPDLRYFSEPAWGGHFASLEQPELFVQEVRAGLRSLRWCQPRIDHRAFSWRHARFSAGARHRRRRGMAKSPGTTLRAAEGGGLGPLLLND